MTDIDEQASEQAGTDDEQGEQAERHGPGTVLDITIPYARVSANVVREWARAVLVPPALQRLYAMGMGTLTFDTPTPAGNVVKIEAPPTVQRAALMGVIAIGIPPTVGIVGETDERPGVIAVGDWDDEAGEHRAHGGSPLEQARAEAHAGMRSLPAIAAGGIEVPEQAGEHSASSAPGYDAPAGHEVVEVHEEAHGSDDEMRDHLRARTVSEADRRAFMAKAILAKRRNGSNGRTNGNGNGTNGNGNGHHPNGAH